MAQMIAIKMLKVGDEVKNFGKVVKVEQDGRMIKVTCQLGFYRETYPFDAESFIEVENG